MNSLRVIFFDAVGTLIHLPKGAAFHYGEVARRHGKEIPAANFGAAFRSVWKEMPVPAATREPRADEDRGWWEIFVNRVLDFCVPGDLRGLDRGAHFSELYAEFIEPGVWDAYPETREVLAELAPHYELGIISNFDPRLRVVLDQLELGKFFRYIVISSEVGANKPDPWIFSEALRLAEVTPDQALLVGDDPIADWQGGEAAGMRVFKLTRPEQSLTALLSLRPSFRAARLL